MPVQSYPTLPTLRQWKKDSAVGNIFKPKRKNDPTLLRIDRMVNSLNKLKGNKWSSDDYFYKLGGLFHTTMYWNNNHKLNPKMDSGRRNAIMRLNLFAANKLARAHGTSIGGLALKLQQMYGTGMAQYGITEDGPGGVKGKYMSAKTLKRFRVLFKEKLGYVFDVTSATGYSLLHTSDFMDTGGRSGWGFVFSMSSELYVVRFETSVPFHSSFMGGMPVQCAGTINFDKGIIDYIKNDSGHYRPIDKSLAQVLRHLKTIGLPIEKIKVSPVEGSGNAKEAWGDEFLAANGNWDAIESSSRTRGHDGWRGAREVPRDKHGGFVT